MEKLTEFQKQVLEECIKKGSGGLSLNMGQGKTFIGLSLGAIFNTGNGKSIVVVSKNLIVNWVFELKKFFGDSLKYLVFHQDNIKNLNTFAYDMDAQIVIVTPEVLAKFYKKYNIESEFIETKMVFNGIFDIPNNQYSKVKKCLLKQFDGSLGSALFSKEWASIIIDEGQNHTNILTTKCQAICSVHTKHRWVMSGTLFNEPKTERILGYYCMINHNTFPRTMSDVKKFITSAEFKGINKTLVYREPTAATNKNGIVKFEQHIITHQLSNKEEIIYISMNKILKDIQAKMQMYKSARDTENMRKYSTYLLAMLTYLRQSTVCPMIVFAKCSLDMIDMENKSHLSNMIYKELNELGLERYLNDPESIKSSRIKAVLDQIDKHPNDNITVFSCFRTSIDILREFVPKDRKTISIDGSMSIKAREKAIDEFKTKNANSKGNVLFLTYDIGAEGLNLQESNTVMLLDMYWNDGKSKQAIARVLRNGQNDKVNIYIFTSNTGVEKAVLGKQDEKLDMIKEMNIGAIKTTIKKIKVEEIIRMIDIYDCVSSLSKKFVRGSASTT